MTTSNRRVRRSIGLSVSPRIEELVDRAVFVIGVLGIVVFIALAGQS